MKKELLLVVFFVMSLFIYSDIYSQSIYYPYSNSTGSICFGECNGDIDIYIDQTSPPTNVELKLLWQNPVTNFWVQLGVSSGTGSLFNFPSRFFLINLLNINYPALNVVAVMLYLSMRMALLNALVVIHSLQTMRMNQQER